MGNDYLSEILHLMQKKYGKIIEIYNLTKEMDEAFKRNDQVSADMIMEMRLEEMKNTDEISASLQKALENMPEDTRPRILCIMESRGSHLSLSDNDELQIYDICGKIHRILERTVQIDKAASLRITGAKSFYSQKSVRG